MDTGHITPPKSIGLSTTIGIASLILEGRSQCDDEDGVDDEVIELATVNKNATSSSSKSEIPFQSFSSATTSYGLEYKSSASGHSNVSNSTTNPVACSSGPSTFAATGAVREIQRLRQKLMLIRSAPGTSRDAIQQAIAVSSDSNSYYASSVDSDDELDTVFTSPPAKHQQQQQQQHRPREGNLLSTLRTLATNTCLNTTPRSFGPTLGLLSTVEAWKPPGYKSSEMRTDSSTSPRTTTTPTPPNQEKKTTCLSMGPHCEEYMKKIGLIKSAKAKMTMTSTPIRTKSMPEEVYVEEHICYESKMNCIRWKTQCIRMESIYAHTDPICIEVYLGPENHVILLEQWIIEQGERTNQMTMTLPSLCSAIRSQLHFSQISAWTEQLNSSCADPSVFRNNPRIQTMSVDRQHIFKYKLDILYRIRPFDNTSCFGEKPHVHNFPDTIVAEGQVIKVCLKSLPRHSTIPTLAVQSPQQYHQMHTIIPSQSPVASSSSSTMPLLSGEVVLDDLMQHPCTAKGKHRCTFEDEEDVVDNTPNLSVSEDPSTLTHRNRQLEKYKRRLQKRDQKKKREDEDDTDSVTASSSSVSGTESVAGSVPNFINSIRPPLYCSIAAHQGLPPVETKSIGIQTCDMPEHHCHPNGAYGGTDESSAYPNCDFCGIEMQFVCWNCDNKLFEPVKLKNGYPQSPLDKAILLLQAIRRTPINKQNALMRNRLAAAAASTSTSATFATNNSTHNKPNNEDMKLSSGELSSFSNTNATTQKNGGANQQPCDNLVGLELSDCHLCKRQKTMHNYVGFNNNNNDQLLSNRNNNFSNNNNNNINVNTYNEKFSLSSTDIATNVLCDVEIEECRMSEGEDDVDDAISSKERIGQQRADLGNYHRRTMSESLDVGNSVLMDQNSELTCRSTEHRRETVLSEMELKMYRRAYSEDVLALGCDEPSDERIIRHPNELFPSHKMELTVDTETSLEGSSNVAQTTCSPSSSLSAMSLNGSSSPTNKSKVATVRKPIPKVNLSRVFDPSPRVIQPTDDCRPLSEPFSIESLTPCEGLLETDIGLVIGAPSNNEFIPVHKSNSAPSFSVPHGSGHMLSPRFLKQNAIQKRRSRHLSDRSSERSSIGSDELFSDEELGCGLDNTYIAMLSPVAGQRGISKKMIPKSYPFGRRALLGSIEESLLQRRFVPKSHVPGFKVLLSASGGFYPTQLTIPSATSFYELHGDSLNTPYMCEVRMPRKGYSIPRKGTVQATLLNPHGMVVRMFVVPYDLRDMPSMHTTFVRQRVLSDNRAEGEPTLSTAEQMKLLRYVIHLRFQTSRSGRLSLHTDIRMVISRRTDCDTAAAHTKSVLEPPSELRTVTVMPDSPKYSERLDKV